MKKIFKQNENKILYSTTINELKKLKIKNWKKNRFIDDKRIEDINEYYKSNNIKCIDGIIYLWQKKEEYYIYDGVHRFSSALMNNNDMNVLVYIYKTNNEYDILNDFQLINKSVPVPDIFITESNNIKKKEFLYSIVDKLCLEYKNFVSSSRRPISPNFNKDNLIEEFSDISIFSNEYENKEDRFYSLLLEYNNIIKNNLINNKINIIKKCEKYNFYLFYSKMYDIKKYIENNWIEVNLMVLD